MPKITKTFNDKEITFDSELEVSYFEFLSSNKEVVRFYYHLPVSIEITKKNKYTPDFVVEYQDRIEVIETKGYNQFSFKSDNLTHSLMQQKSENELKTWLELNLKEDSKIILDLNKNVLYKKIKHLNGFGFVEFSFKNPNTIANKRKNKIKELEQEIKDLKSQLKDYKKYVQLLSKGKLTKTQAIWFNSFKESVLNDTTDSK